MATGWWPSKTASRSASRPVTSLDWTHKVLALAEAIRRLRPPQLILDGEVVAFDDRGISDFQLLQNAFRDPAGGRTAYLVFDLLYRDGVDLRALPLDERKRELARLKLPADRGPLRMSEAVIGHGPQVFEAAGRTGLEGIVSKRRQSPYRWGARPIGSRSNARIIPSSSSADSPTRAVRVRDLVGLLGYFDRQRRLVYAGRVGTGFSDTLIAQLIRACTRFEPRTTPFAQLPLGAGGRGVHWVRPELVADSLQQLDTRPFAAASGVPGSRLTRRPARFIATHHSTSANAPATQVASGRRRPARRRVPATNYPTAV